MGGPGSGSWYRWDKKPTVNSSLCLRVSDLRKHNVFQSTMPGTWSWYRGDQRAGQIGYQMMGDDRMMLDYTYDKQPRKNTIKLTTTPCHYGGQRYWFLCPGCDRRVGVLASPYGWFRCRHCNKIGYDSENHTAWDRIIAKRRKIKNRLESGKRMQRKTRERLRYEYYRLDMLSEQLCFIALKSNRLTGIRNLTLKDIEQWKLS